MKVVLYLCLIMAAIQPSVTVQQEQFTTLYLNRTVNARNLQIPENSWLKGMKRTRESRVLMAIRQFFFGFLAYLFMSPTETHSPFKSVKYLKDIPADSPIRLNYTVQYLNPSHIWTNLIHDSVLLCYTIVEVTQHASILALVRELLGIPEGCPVSAGEERIVDDIQLPFTGRSLFFNGYLPIGHIRIFTNLYEDDRHSGQKLFSGEFDIIG